MNKKQLLIFVPTYNERENIKKLYREIKNLNIDFDMLFMDDNSPDGSGEIIDQLVQRESNVKVIHRPSKMGIGSAHLEGIKFAFKNGYKLLITMDCDFSHQPNYIKDFLCFSGQYPLVIGSRYINTESLPQWSLVRRFLTHLGHFVTKNVLKVPYDATGAYRLYHLDKIPQELFDSIHSKRYSFFFESIHFFHINGISIKEIPLILPARTYGHSKMSYKDIFYSIYSLVKIYLKTIFRREKLKFPRYEATNNNSSNTKIQPSWDEYWLKKNRAIFFIYDLIAEFYRKYVIKRTLNHFVKKYFLSNLKVLHAGCGSGKTDSDLAISISIIALDISIPALNLYKINNNSTSKVICGSILGIPLKNASVEGIYNLGVMEHFTEREIYKALGEFHRILKPEGNIVIFWPPEFGLSVIFLKFAHFMLNKIFKRNIGLHPDEISCIKNKEQVKSIFQKANFNVAEYYFGVRDFFTYSVIVAKK